MSPARSINSSLITVKELAEYLRLKPQTIRHWISCDLLPDGLPKPFKRGKLNYWHYSDIETFINGKRG